MSTGILEQVDPFKFAATSYLCWWIEVDRSYFQWSHPSRETLNEFLIRYKVRRTIPGNDLAGFISIIERNRSAPVESAVFELVDDACKEIALEYKRRCLSAVSKVLWMTHGHPIAIYDAFARNGLEKQAGLKKFELVHDYQSYYSCWLQQFRAHEAQVQAVQAWLPRSVLFTRLVRLGAATEDGLRSSVNQLSFANRIFDHWLMNIGSDWVTNGNVVDVARLFDPAEVGL